MLTAGLDKTLRLFAVDGEENPKVASYFFKKFPIREAKFTPAGDRVLLTGRENRMWSLDVRTGQATSIMQSASQLLQRSSRYRCLEVGPYPSDLPSLRANQMYSVLGDDGKILVCDVATSQPVRTLRMSMPGVASVFSPEKDVLFSADKDCNIYEWDLGTGRCMQRVKATYAIGIESLALRRVTATAPTPLLAVGTASGNIDLYDTSVPKMTGKPTSSIDNLTTAVTSLKFHPAGELLSGASKLKKDTLKLIHCGTSTVFWNWPTERTPLNRVTSVDFTRQGGFMAIASEQGKVLIYQLRQYEKMG
jgi:U3 small nucleolar RNA-associated protein 18